MPAEPSPAVGSAFVSVQRGVALVELDRCDEEDDGAVRLMIERLVERAESVLSPQIHVKREAVAEFRKRIGAHVMSVCGSDAARTVRNTGSAQRFG